MKAVTNPERCKACGLCMVHCPRQALELTNKLNSGGYQTISVHQESCVGCGICYLVCPDGVFSITEQEVKENG